MKSRALLGIYREKIFSPGRVEDDAAIMDRTLEELSRIGWVVEALPAESVERSTPRPENVVSMAQSNRVLTIEEEWTREGTLAVNTASAVRNCYRKPLTRILSGAGIPIPPSKMFTLREALDGVGLGPSIRVWLKRGDVHAMEPEDVVSVVCREELIEALEYFHTRGIPDIVVQDHSRGPVVKFYGVGRGDFFKAYPASGKEELTSGLEPLRAVAERAAEAVGLDIYGGDAVLTSEEGAILIDLNDWPSFSRCRGAAASSIARYAAARFQSVDCGDSLFTGLANAY
jgi:hypothetical protein